MDDRNSERFSSDEAGELIRRATEISQRQDDGLTYEQVVEVAAEVGITEDAVAQALEQARREEALKMAAADQPSAWRTVADRCLEILCLKRPVSTESRPQTG